MPCQLCQTLSITYHTAPKSQLAEIYLIAHVVHYDDLYRQMQFATACKWGTESQFIYQQPLHKSDAKQPGLTKQANHPLGRSTPTINLSRVQRLWPSFGASENLNN